MLWFAEELHSYEGNPSIEDSSTALYRQMDTKDFVFVEPEALPPWTAEAPRRNGLPAHADQNSSQTGVNRIDYETRDGVENCCRRILFDSLGENNNRPAWRYVPMGEASWEARDC